MQITTFFANDINKERESIISCEGAKLLINNRYYLLTENVSNGNLRISAIGNRINIHPLSSGGIEINVTGGVPELVE